MDFDFDFDFADGDGEGAGLGGPGGIPPGEDGEAAWGLGGALLCGLVDAAHSVGFVTAALARGRGPDLDGLRAAREARMEARRNPSRPVPDRDPLRYWRHDGQGAALATPLLAEAGSAKTLSPGSERAPWRRTSPEAPSLADETDTDEADDERMTFARVLAGPVLLYGGVAVLVVATPLPFIVAALLAAGRPSARVLSCGASRGAATRDRAPRPSANRTRRRTPFATGAARSCPRRRSARSSPYPSRQ